MEGEMNLHEHTTFSKSFLQFCWAEDNIKFSTDFIDLILFNLK